MKRPIAASAPGGYTPPMDIFDHQNHRDFLRAYLQGKKAGGLRGLATKAGFKSAGHITMLVKGERRLTAESAGKLIAGLGLRGRKRAMMLAFARLDAAKTEKDKTKVREEILRLKSYQPEHRLAAKQFSYLGTWYYPVTFSLLHSPTCPQDPASLAERLGRGITPAQVGEAIEDLQVLNLIERREDGRWHPLSTAVTTPKETRSLAIGKYHRNSVKLAEEALELPIDAREFNGLTVTVPAHLLPKVKEKIRTLRSELNELLGGDSSPAEVYQINLQLFPLTKGLERNTQ